ncbi:MAG: acylphosphatase [Erysipelotrichaceae bacterium]|nr:acylphosphatase [Erysipelotrichaceae bacterium]
MKRFKAVVSGRVQNVGFRTFATMNAQQCHLTGMVTNLENGDVEVVIQGEQKDIDEFLELTRKGNRFIRVDNIQLKMLPVVEGEKKFTYHW